MNLCSKAPIFGYYRSGLISIVMASWINTFSVGVKAKEENQTVEVSTDSDCKDEETGTTETEPKTPEPDPIPLPDTCEFHHRDEV